MRLIDRIALIPRRRIADHRGWFLKVIDGTEQGVPARTGEVYLTYALPGEARGDHYHPATAEWFTLIDGRARLLAADPASGAWAEFALDAATPQTVYMPAGLAHVFLNESAAPSLLLAYAENLYDPSDTVPFAIPREAPR